MFNTRSYSGFASGKVIITGEHSVVFGHPAVVTCIEPGITVAVQLAAQSGRQKTLSAYELHILSLFSAYSGNSLEDVTWSSVSALPARSGLGSSAAFASALFQALAAYSGITLSKESLYKLVFAAEVQMHTNPSGIDPYAVVYRGTHLFQKDSTQGAGFRAETLSVAKPTPIVLVNSGPATETTGTMVGAVARLCQTSAHAQKAIEELGRTSSALAAAVRQGILDAELITHNQRLLETIGIVGENARRSIALLESAGCAAKVTGAGGVATGSGWLLTYHPDRERILELAEHHGWEILKTTIQ